MALGRYYIPGALALIIAAVFSTGFHHWDEHFQILEFAGTKLGITPVSDLPWEFGAQMRPALQPLLVVLLYRGMAVIHEVCPFFLTSTLRMLSAAVTFLSVLLLIRTYLPSISDLRLRRIFLLLSFFMWFGVYEAVRFSSENWSGMCFIIAFAIIMRPNMVLGWWGWVGCGALLGLAFVFRYQTGLMIAGLVLWLIMVYRQRIGHVALLLAGVMISVAIGVLADRWFYGSWVSTLWNYIDQNLLQGKANAFGTEPWWEYFAETFIRAVPPFSLLVILAPLILFIFRPRHVLTWVLVPFILVHSLIGHKEIRFLFPMIGLLPIVIILAMEVVQVKWWPNLLEMRAVRIFLGAGWVVNLVFLFVVLFKPADAQIPLYRAVHDIGPEKLYTLGDDPYDRVAPIHFYRPAGMTIAPYPDDPRSLEGIGNYLVVTRNREAATDLLLHGELVYSSIPEWARAFNFNGWVERTDAWFLIRNSGDPAQ